MKSAKKTRVFDSVYDIVRQIPKGKVVTYGYIARILGINDARVVGWALHANKDPLTPCHRVVSKEGRLSKSFAFNGEEEQRRRLVSEGVILKNKSQVDFQRSLLLQFK